MGQGEGGVFVAVIICAMNFQFLAFFNHFTMK